MHPDPVTPTARYVCDDGRVLRPPPIWLCHWPGCEVEIPRNRWACAQHWSQLPDTLRLRMMAAYTPGQDVTCAPTDEFILAASEAQLWVCSRGLAVNTDWLTQRRHAQWLRRLIERFHAEAKIAALDHAWNKEDLD